jgi:hypothetical protein
MEMLIGLNAKLYQGNPGSPAASEVTIVGTVKLALEVGEATVKIRASQFELSETTLFKAGLEFDILWDDTDSNFNALWTAFTSRTARAFKCLSKANGKGIDADFKIFKFERNEDPEQGLMASVAIKPCPSTRAPAFV